MFKRGKAITIPTLFTGFGQVLGEKKMKRIEDKTSWENIFREQVIMKVDEGLFSVLYSQENGRPNTSIRVLVGMMILKEGFGWSDSELYEACRFNLLVMNAIGLSNVSDEVPVESTYYEFKKKLYDYEIKTGRNIIAEVYEKTTKTQAEIFSVNSKWIRMDSKLVGSNITNCSRLQLIISCLQEFYKSLEEETKKQISEEDRIVLEELVKKKAHNIVYKLTNEEKTKYLQNYGQMLTRLVKTFKDKEKGIGSIEREKYLMIVRLLTEQYKNQEEAGTVEPKPGKTMTTDIIQSPYDLDAAYRNKDGRGVKGYIMNLTETCNKNELNLILGTEIYKANYPDCEMFLAGVKQAEKICGKVEQVSVDGAYHSPENHEYAMVKNIQIHLGGIPGSDGNYDFEFKGKDLEVKNIETGEIQIAKFTPKGYYKIKELNGKIRYFRQIQLDNYERRKIIEALPKEVRNVRCNVEASIFQSCFQLRKDKTKYRGLIKTKLWACCRVMWINSIRIKNYLLNQHSKKLSYVH